MTKNSRVIFYFIFISVLVINITTLINGVQKHETWRVIMGAASLGLMVIAGIIVLISSRRHKNKQAS